MAMVERAVVVASGAFDNSERLEALLHHFECGALMIGVVELSQHKRPTDWGLDPIVASMPTRSRPCGLGMHIGYQPTLPSRVGGIYGSFGAMAQVYSHSHLADDFDPQIVDLTKLWPACHCMALAEPAVVVPSRVFHNSERLGPLLHHFECMQCIGDWCGLLVACQQLLLVVVATKMELTAPRAAHQGSKCMAGCAGWPILSTQSAC